MRAGGLGWLGLGLADLFRGQARAGEAAPRKARAVILAFCPGGPSHIETFDTKPDAPSEVRGPFGVIDTSLPGVRCVEHLPELSRRMHRATLVRSMVTTSPVHELAVHRLLGGMVEPPEGTGVAASRLDAPHVGSLVAAMRLAPQGLPPTVTLPTRLEFQGAVFPGQHAGFLGPRFDPWHFVGDPGADGFGPPVVELPDSLTLERMERRERLLREIESQRAAIASAPNPFDPFRAKAADLLASPACREAFDLGRESPRTRDRYGRTLMGQGLLLGRRLAEAGVPLVQVNLGESNVWDTHKENCRKLKDELLPPFDRAVSALIDDLTERGLMDEVLVVVTGEFGRTPHIGRPIAGGAGASPDGRDHWPGVFTLLAFGAGVARGGVVGASDRLAAHPITDSYSPADLAATVLASLGIAPDAIARDAKDRPFRINHGNPIPWG